MIASSESARSARQRKAWGAASEANKPRLRNSKKVSAREAGGRFGVRWQSRFIGSETDLDWQRRLAVVMEHSTWVKPDRNNLHNPSDDPPNKLHQSKKEKEEYVRS